MLNLFKGWFGEKAATFGLWVHLDDSDCHRVHDLIVPAPDGTTQLDHVIVSRFGSRYRAQPNSMRTVLRQLSARSASESAGGRSPFSCCTLGFA